MILVLDVAEIQPKHKETGESPSRSAIGRVGFTESASINVNGLLKIYSDFISHLTSLNERAKKLAAPEDSPDDGLQELTDQVSILIVQLRAYRDLLQRENTKALDLNLLNHIAHSEEVADVSFYSTAVGNKLADLSTTWDVTRISHLNGTADLLESFDDVVKLVHGVVLGREEFSRKLDTFKQKLLGKLEELSGSTIADSEPSIEEIKVVLSDLNGIEEPAERVGNGMEALYDGLEKLKLKIEESSKS